MTQRLRYVFVLVLFAASAAGGANAQALRSSGHAFLVPRAGLSVYAGDHNKGLFGDAFDVDGQFPYVFGLELGYQLSVPVSLSLAYQYGNYPLINRAGRALDVLEDDPTSRNTFQLFGRYAFGGPDARVAPYLLGGGHVTFGDTQVFGTVTEESRSAFGPTLGLGLDFALSPRVGLMLEGTGNLAFPDDAADGREGDRFGSFDLLGAVTLGLKLNFAPAGVAPRILSIDGPARLRVGEVGTFTATMNEDASEPVSYQWNFADGTTAPGRIASHAFTRPGTYTVSFTARNRGGDDTRTLSVTVVEAATPPSIVTIEAVPRDPDTQTEVRFNASIRGDGPLTYAWDFGDGATSAEASPVHTYDEAGTYTVSLTVTNDAGSDTRSLSLTVRPYEAEICSEINEMNSVFFGRNSSVLTDEGRAVLMENVEILRECPNMSARLEGYAAPGERNPQELSEARATTVESFYIDQGISPGRLLALGRGRGAGTTSKKDGAAQFQRVDTIPLR